MASKKGPKSPNRAQKASAQFSGVFESQDIFQKLLFRSVEAVFITKGADGAESKSANFAPMRRVPWWIITTIAASNGLHFSWIKSLTCSYQNNKHITLRVFESLSSKYHIQLLE